MKHLSKILLVVLALTLAISFAPVRVSASTNYLSISVGLNVEAQIEPAPIDTSPPSLDIRFEPSGTHIHKGDLKIRLDFYPQPEDKSYSMHHVFVVDETSPEFLDGYKGEVDKGGNPIDFTDYEKWIEGLPHVWRTNPALCHFLTIKPDITLAELDQIVKDMFSGGVTATIDDIAIQSNSAHLFSPYMKVRSSSTSIKINSEFTNEQLLVETINTRLAGFTVGEEGDSINEEVVPRSIDIGSPATSRASTFTYGSTLINVDNPANADGVLDTMQVYERYGGEQTYCGTFSGSSTSYNDRDYEDLGWVTPDSTQTFTGLTCDVVTGDFLGVALVATYGGAISRDTSGYSGLYSKSGNWFGSGAQTYSLNTGDTISAYATGTEAASFDISNDPSTEALGLLATSTTYYAFGSAPSNPVEDGECTFTVTNAGSACDLDMKIADFTGGVGWNIGAPGQNQVRVTAYYSGQDPSAGLVLANTDAEFYDGLADSATIMWDFMLESSTSHTDSANKSATLTITAVTED